MHPVPWYRVNNFRKYFIDPVIPVFWRWRKMRLAATLRATRSDEIVVAVTGNGDGASVHVLDANESRGEAES